MLDVYRLRLLRELDRRGTLAAVARALSYSPSAISQQLRQLESETGVTLLERAHRRQPDGGGGGRRRPRGRRGYEGPGARPSPGRCWRSIPVTWR